MPRGRARARKGQSTGKNEPLELRAYARGWWLEQPQSGSNCLEIENCLDFPRKIQSHSFARSGNDARGIDPQAAPEKGCRLKRITEKICQDNFEGLMSAASFPRTRESRQNNRRPLLDLSGCPPEPVLSEVEGRA